MVSEEKMCTVNSKIK